MGGVPLSMSELQLCEPQEEERSPWPASNKSRRNINQEKITIPSAVRVLKNKYSWGQSRWAEIYISFHVLVPFYYKSHPQILHLNWWGNLGRGERTEIAGTLVYIRAGLWNKSSFGCMSPPGF